MTSRADQRSPLRRALEVVREARTIAVEDLAPAALQRWEALRSSGLQARPLDFDRDRVVLLFYEDFDRDRLVAGDRHAIRVARRLLQAARLGQKVTGFGVAFAALTVALERAGYHVRINDAALAKANPDYPIGIAGYTHILDHWDLPNPAVLGPGLFDHPSLRPELMSDPRFVRYIVPCEWMRTLFGRTYPVSKIGLFFAGIELEAWPDTASQKKDLDFIVYDKVRWEKDEIERSLVKPVLAELDRRGLSYERLVYKKYDHATYRELLGRARGLIFLCEHETQGLAYQEALASNVPVLAWDCAEWRDPMRFGYGESTVPASSVPYFDRTCGERFADAKAFGPALDRFVEGLRASRYAPRAYVHEHLSLDASARAYLKLYRDALDEGQRRKR